MNSQVRVLLAGGGSLGSVYPGLSIARWLERLIPGVRVVIAGDGRAIERHTVQAAGLSYTAIPTQGFSTRLSGLPVRALRRATAWCLSRWVLREQEIDLVISLGGQTSGPMAQAARDLGLPCVLLEQNLLPTPATRLLAPGAAAVCLAFEETAARLPLGCDTRLTGGVGRPGFEDMFSSRPGDRPTAAEDDGRPRLVVLGGVAGACSLNQSTPPAVARLAERVSGWKVVHQSGTGWLTRTERRYREAGVEAVVVSYIDQLAHLARSSDLVVCRPSGSTLAELAMAGLPAILVPDSRRPERTHQANADFARQRYGCPVVDEAGGDLASRLAATLERIAADSPRRDDASARLVRDARPHAAEAIARIACEALGLQPNNDFGQRTRLKIGRRPLYRRAA